LSSEELVNFVRNGVSGVISEIWTRFVGGRSGSRALPSRDVHSLQVFREIDNLHGVQGTIGHVEVLGCLGILKEFPHLLGLNVGGIFNGDR